MIKKLPLSLIACTSFFIQSQYAQADGFPKGCAVTGYGYQSQYLVLNDTGAQTLFLIRNRVDKLVEMQRHETKDVFMSPPLKGTIESLKWGAFASDEQNTYFKCYIREGENTAMVNCQDVLDVCQYPRVKFALSNMGNYWVSYNKTQNQVINDAVNKGIYLRW